MNFGFLVDQDTTRYCYLRLRRLKAAAKDAALLDAVAAQLAAPAAAGQKKLAAIDRRIEQLRGAGGSLWHDVPAPEVLAASMFEARARAAEIIDALFCRAPRAQDLAQPLLTWMNIAGLTPFEGGVAGTGRANILGFRPGGMLSEARIVGIEALNDAAELGRAIDAMTASRGQALVHASYVACTPAVAAEFLWAQATAPGTSRWDADALRRKLAAAGCGLLLVEGDAVAQAILPKERMLDKPRLAALVTAVQQRSKIGG